MADTNISQWLTRAQASLASAGIESPALEARLLLAHALGVDATYLFTWPERVIDERVQVQCDDYLTQRLQGVPIAYITKTREFWSLPLYVDGSTLIPRADTETLVDWALTLAPKLATCAQVLDLGTGTGAIALALGSERPNWHVLGVDVQADAVALSVRNQQHLALNNVAFMQSDWFDQMTGRFDLITSNPPYIDDNDPHLECGDVRFEPRSALVAPNAGLADLEHIIDCAPQYLNDGGWLLLEHGYQQGRHVSEALHARGFTAIETRTDLAGQPRISGGCWRVST